MSANPVSRDAAHVQHGDARSTQQGVFVRDDTPASVRRLHKQQLLISLSNAVRDTFRKYRSSASVKFHSGISHSIIKLNANLGVDHVVK